MYLLQKKVIQKPQLEKRIPSTSINKWRKDLANGQNATCSQIGCQYTSNSFDEIKSHYSTCNFTPQEVKFDFIQQQCLFSCCLELLYTLHIIDYRIIVVKFADSNLQPTKKLSSMLQKSTHLMMKILIYRCQMQNRLVVTIQVIMKMLIKVNHKL